METRIFLLLGGQRGGVKATATDRGIRSVTPTGGKRDDRAEGGRNAVQAMVEQLPRREEFRTRNDNEGRKK